MEIYFLDFDGQWDHTIDDITFSQICNDVENDHEMSLRLDDITLSQALDRYEVDAAMDDVPDLQSDFELADTEITAENVIEILAKTVTKNCSESRYSFIEDSDIQTPVSTNESKNTRKNTNWNVSTFNDWRGARMLVTGCVIPDLASVTAADINQWFTKFAIEASHKDGLPYPPKTLYLLCVGLLRHLREMEFL